MTQLSLLELTCAIGGKLLELTWQIDWELFLHEPCMARHMCWVCLFRDRIDLWHGEHYYTNPRNGWYRKVGEEHYYDYPGRSLMCKCEYADMFGFELTDNDNVALIGDSTPFRLHEIDYCHGRLVKIIHTLLGQIDVPLDVVVTEAAAKHWFRTFVRCVRAHLSDRCHHYDIHRYLWGRWETSALKCTCSRTLSYQKFEILILTPQKQTDCVCETMKVTK